MFINKFVILGILYNYFNNTAHLSQRTWENTSDDIYKVYTEFFNIKDSDKNNHF